MGISEREYQAMLKSNGGPDGIAVISDPGKVTIDYGQLGRQAGSLGLPTVQALTNPLPPSLVAQSIVLPLPPSTNANWGHFSERTVLSEETRNYRKNVRLLANIARVQPFDGDVAVYVHVYRSRADQDLDNYDSKTLLDALHGVLFHDDIQVVERHSWRHDDKTNPRVEVEVEVRRISC